MTTHIDENGLMYHAGGNDKNSLLQQALQATDEGRFEAWFLALSPEQKEAFKMILQLEDYRAAQVILSTQKGEGPKETK